MALCSDAQIVTLPRSESEIKSLREIIPENQQALSLLVEGVPASVPDVIVRHELSVVFRSQVCPSTLCKPPHYIQLDKSRTIPRALGRARAETRNPALKSLFVPALTLVFVFFLSFSCPFLVRIDSRD